MLPFQLEDASRRVEN
jgi:nondiscriminating aspartyl-tRNA synthetase